MTLNDFKAEARLDREARSRADSKDRVLPAWDTVWDPMNDMRSYTIASFRKENARVDPRVISSFMNLRVVDYMDCIVRLSNGRFKPDINRLLKYSDCDSDYMYYFGLVHNKVNRDIRVCELLTVAAKILSNCMFVESEAREGVYIVNCLLVFPFTVLKDCDIISKPTDQNSDNDTTERRDLL